MPNIMRFGGGGINVRTYLYNAGDECMPLTNGWNVSYTTKVTGTLTKETTFFNFLNITGSHILETGILVNLAPFTKLYIDWEGSGNGSKLFEVGSNKGGYDKAAVLDKTGVFTRQIMEIDVNALSGSYYVRTGVSATAGNPSAAKIYAMWGEGN